MEKLQLQQACFENIKALCSNYKKDSASRKTEDYLTKRLESLEAQWNDFEERHAILEQTVEDRNINYFVDNVYSKTQALYESTKQDMLHLLEQLQGKRFVNFDLTGMLDRDTDGTTKALLSKQECNFKALDRAMSKIDIKAVTEKWELEDHLSILKSKWNAIDKQHWELEALLKGSNATYYNMFVDMEDKYDELRKNLNNKIWSTVHYEKSAPKIEVPEFSGSYTQWISFKDLFMETIHNNPMINKAQKMQHLKTRLKGEAERLVQHLCIGAENYTSCWEILTQRFDNRRMQLTSFLNTMLNLPVIQQPDSFNLKKMHDVITECTNGLTNIGLDIVTWDPIIVHLMSQKLDTTTYSEYIKELRDPRDVPNLTELLYFLENKFMAYETMKNTKKEVPNQQKQFSSKPSNKNNSSKPHDNERKTFFKRTYHTAYGHCPNCDGKHVLMKCPKFIDMDAFQRNSTVAKLNVCKNCLYSHGNTDCGSTKTCKECNMTHHTLLHNANKKNNDNLGHQSTTSTNKQNSNHISTNEMEVLLTTVKLKIKSANGDYITLRALLDQGSQVNLITENAAQMLRLPRKRLNATITGVGAAPGNSKGRLQLTCKSIHSDYAFETQALILSKLTNNLPNSSFEKANWPHLENLKLADPEFNVSSPIDLLLGADVYSDIILDGVLKGCQQSPVAQQTHLGWILCGKLKTFNCHITLVDLSELTKFWENEDITISNHDIPKDNMCEEYYNKTVQRDADNKYIVKMPMSSDLQNKLGKSRSMAISQFLQLEKRLGKNKKLSTMYRDFIREYMQLKHMKPAASPTAPSTSECYLPHHGVLREQSTTTKLRVVFNASQKTTTGYSLNSLMEKGPNLQKDIQALILKWRSYKYAFTADIEKMYRCIGIAEDQQALQKIIWRESPNERLQEFQLCTVTYGTKCAPWLAMRTMKQLALDDGHKYPEAANTLLNEFYVDDVISGHYSVDKAKELQSSLINLLKGGGMNLRKWSANHPALLESLTDDQISTKSTFDFKTEDSTKTLGVGWNPNIDTFMFNWSLEEKPKGRTTKRHLLSDISKLYDPLGWLAPITVSAKLLFQRVWNGKLAWDEELPNDIRNDWDKLKTDLPNVRKIKLNRWIGAQQSIELLGFCDASEKAYACVIYSRVRDEQDLLTVTLLVAKTRVAPLSQKTTLPRLELCGALLLAKPMEKTKEALAGYNVSIQAWCDSQVVLAWLQGDASRWDRYVSNRVDKIKQTIPADKWRYVKSAQNPADCASRGMMPSKLINFNLWWQGPEFLKMARDSDLMKNSTCLFTTDQETVNSAVATTTVPKNNEHLISNLLHKYSSLTQVIRVTAQVLRFIAMARSKMKFETNYLSVSELKLAADRIIAYVQSTEFKNEYLTQLQTRGKWNKPRKNIEEGDIVLIKDNNLPPGKWAMGRVLELHPGSDGYVRAITVKTQSGIMKRPVVKLSPLPIERSIQDHTDKIDTTTSKTSGNKGFSTLLTMLLIVFTLITGSYGEITTSGVQITNFEVERPIYYDTIGNVQIIHDEWTLLMYYNLTTYWEGVHRIEAYLEGMNELCQKTDPRYCKTTLEQLNHELEILNYYNDILLAPHKHLSNRKKRGLIDGVGYVANSLFGILDQRFADKYHNDIQAVQNNEKYLLDLVKNQTSIVELQNNMLKKNEQNIKQQFGLIDDFMTQTNTNLVKVESEMEIVMATNYFNSASLTAYLLINNLERVQEMLFESLTDVYKGHIDIHLLTPVNLIKQLTEITAQLPRTSSLPVRNIRDDIKDLYKLLYVRARVTTNYFLFEIHVPLISDEDFTLYQATPLPMKTSTGTVIVQLASQYIAVNFGKSTYVSLSEDDMKRCSHLQPGNLICNKNLPIFNLHNSNAPCEAKLLGHRTTSPCDVKKVLCKQEWIALHSTNTWLAICCGTCTIRIVCENDITTRSMTSGILTLPQGCLLQSKDLTIHAHNQYNSNMKMDLSMNLPSLNSVVNNIVNITHNISHVMLPETAELEEIDKRLAVMKTRENQLPSTISTHDIHQYAVSYTIVGVIVMVAVGWFVKRYGPSCRSKQTKSHSATNIEEIELQTIQHRRQKGDTHTASQAELQAERPRCADNIAFTFE